MGVTRRTVPESFRGSRFQEPADWRRDCRCPRWTRTSDREEPGGACRTNCKNGRGTAPADPGFAASLPGDPPLLARLASPCLAPQESRADKARYWWEKSDGLRRAWDLPENYPAAGNGRRR